MIVWEDTPQLIRLGINSLGFEVDVVSFNLREKKSDRISLSWHLTKQEKQKIFNAIKSEGNVKASKQLLKLLEKERGPQRSPLSLNL